MSLEQVLFYLMAAITLGSALFVAATKNLVRCIFMFFITLFGLAGLYVLSLADFVAITQVVIYIGGILVLILFAFMLSGKESLNVIEQQRGAFISIKNLPALLLSGSFLVVLVNMVFKVDVNNLDWIKRSVASKNNILPTSNMTENIGVNLMTKYLLPFEAVSVLLMVALIGAAHLSRREQQP
jgi:NADH:ubiquinone oxidoreductase subunit 6 (subunit J)